VAIMVDASMSTTMRPLAVPLAEYRCRLTHIQTADKSIVIYPRHLAKYLRSCETMRPLPCMGDPESIYIIFVGISRNIEKAMW
jgi:hypothetical protein